MAYRALAAGLEQRLSAVESVSIRRLSRHEALLRAITGGRVTLAAVDPFVARLAAVRDAATVLVQLSDHGGWTQRSHIVVRREDDVDELPALVDRAVAMGPLLSLADSVAPLGALADAGLFDPVSSAASVSWYQPTDALGALRAGGVVAAAASDRVLDDLPVADRAGVTSIESVRDLPDGPFVVASAESATPSTATLVHGLSAAVASGDAAPAATGGTFDGGFTRARTPPDSVLSLVDECGGPIHGVPKRCRDRGTER